MILYKNSSFYTVNQSWSKSCENYLVITFDPQDLSFTSKLWFFSPGILLQSHQIMISRVENHSKMEMNVIKTQMSRETHGFTGGYFLYFLESFSFMNYLWHLPFILYLNSSGVNHSLWLKIYPVKISLVLTSYFLSSSKIWFQEIILPDVC